MCLSLTLLALASPNEQGITLPCVFETPMAQPSQQSFTRQSYGTRQLCSIGYQIKSLLIAISQTRTICISGITASTSHTRNRALQSLSFAPPNQSQTPLYPGTHEQHNYGRYPSSCSSCQQKSLPPGKHRAAKKTRSVPRQGARIVQTLQTALTIRPSTRPENGCR